MTEERIWPVVVGVDGSTTAAAALDVAAVEALARAAPLKIVHAYVWPLFYASLANIAYQPSDWEPAEETQTTVRAAARRVSERYPDLEVHTAVHAGGGGQVLVEESAHAALVVVGSRGAGGLAGRLSGPVAPHVAAHARCPVLIVPTRSAAGLGVYVGVDGTPSSLAALTFACDWAKRHDSDVDAIHVLPHASAADQALLDSWLADARATQPGVVIHSTVLAASDASAALVQASRTARLIVVGSRHRGALRSAVLGSVGHDLIRRSRCPVAVVHGWPQPAEAFAAAGALAAGTPLPA